MDERMGDGRMQRGVKGSLRATLIVLGLCASATHAGTARAAVATMSFMPEADAHVSAAQPDASYGTSKTLFVDRKPARQTFMRFDVKGLGGRTVVGARLRMYQTNGSDLGGRVFSSPSTNWTEAVTWNTRPTLGSQLGAFDAVAASNFYEADLDPTAFADGKVTLALDSTSGDDSRWRSREFFTTKAGSGKVPRLILAVESGDAIADGLSEVAAPRIGSSSPTYYGTQHRLAITEAGRLLTVHGHHGTGVQLAWRDPAGNWQVQTRGDVFDGILNGPTGTGDWPASIAVGRDTSGGEHAWVVFARASAGKVDSAYLRRLSDLDSPLGPTVGPTVAFNSPPGGAYKPDIALAQSGPGGRGVVVWGRKLADGTHESVAGWLTDLDSDQPSIGSRAVIDASPSGNRWGTVVPHGDGTHIVLRRGNGRIRLLDNPAGEPPTTWESTPDSKYSVNGYPSAIALDSGEIVSVAETNHANNVVTVQRYSAADIAQPVELSLTGYSTPTIASDGVNAWIVMVRDSDGFLVSRSYSPGSGWSADDRVEVGHEGGGDHDFPNLLRETDGRLRLVVEGPNFDSVRSSVLAFQRGL